MSYAAVANGAIRVQIVDIPDISLILYHRGTLLKESVAPAGLEFFH